MMFLAAFSTGLAGCGSQAPEVAERPVIRVADSSTARPLQFHRMVVDMDRGTEIGRLGEGIDFCTDWRRWIYRPGQLSFSTEELTETFGAELRAANYNVVGDPDALFDDPSDWKAEYLVAGAVKNMKAELCYSYGSFEGDTDVSGFVVMDVNWQVYSRLDRRVVYQTTTQGRGVTSSSVTGDPDVFLDAFAQATRNLLGDRGFYELITGDVPSTEQAKRAGHAPTAFAPRGLFTQPIAANMAAVRNNVVVVYAGGGHGSGFVIDDAGDLLTNEHVVRTAERVRVRFESGEEATAAVLATDVRRDVALLRIDRGGTGGLPIRSELPAIGAEVYAVGAPLDPSYSATVSKGIVSALRTIDGELWIQSDVNVQPGNSGGPLLDARGNIVGITSRGESTDAGTPSGINFFVPIADALSRLGLSLRGAAS
jgi:S1-C subfamily serine protease